MVIAVMTLDVVAPNNGVELDQSQFSGFFSQTKFLPALISPLFRLELSSVTKHSFHFSLHEQNTLVFCVIRIIGRTMAEILLKLVYYKVTQALCPGSLHRARCLSSLVVQFMVSLLDNTLLEVLHEYHFHLSMIFPTACVTSNSAGIVEEQDFSQ